MKKIKLNGKQLPKEYTENKGTCYVHKIANDYGTPVMRQNRDISGDNVALRTGLSKPKLAKRRQDEAQIDKKDLKSFGQAQEAQKLAMSQKIWELN